MQITTSEILGNIYEIDVHSENPSEIINSLTESDFPCNIKLNNSITNKSITFNLPTIKFVPAVASKNAMCDLINGISEKIYKIDDDADNVINKINEFSESDVPFSLYISLENGGYHTWIIEDVNSLNYYKNLTRDEIVNRIDDINRFKSDEIINR